MCMGLDRCAIFLDGKPQLRSTLLSHFLIILFKLPLFSRRWNGCLFFLVIFCSNYYHYYWTSVSFIECSAAGPS